MEGNDLTKLGKKFCAAVTAAAITLSQVGFCTTSFAEEDTVAADEAHALYSNDAAGSYTTPDEDTILDDSLTNGEASAEEDDGEYTPGDTNNDGKIDAADITGVISYLKGNSNKTPRTTKACDANEDGAVNAADITTIIAHLKGDIDLQWRDKLETVPESELALTEPETYTIFDSIISEKKDINIRMNDVQGAMGYVITYVKNGKEYTLAENISTLNSVLTTELIGTATVVTVKIKPYKYVNTATEKGVRTFMEGYSQTVVFKPENISSQLTVESNTNSVTLNWSAATGANYYEVYYTISGEYEKLYTTTSSTNCTISVVGDKKYTFRVLPISVVNADGRTVTAKASESVSATVTTKPYYELAAKTLDQVGWNLRKAYDWCGNMYFNGTGLTKDGSSGTDWYAEYGFTNGYGNSYVMAACFYQMARMLGYDAHQIAGYVKGNSGNWLAHSWVEIDNYNGSGKTYIFDPDFTVETGKDGFAILYGTSNTWGYDFYGEYSKKIMD